MKGGFTPAAIGLFAALVFGGVSALAEASGARRLLRTPRATATNNADLNDALEGVRLAANVADTMKAQPGMADHIGLTAHGASPRFTTLVQ